MYSTPGLTPTDAVPAPPGAVSGAELDLRTVERLRRSEHERTLARLSALGIVRQSEQSIAWVGDLQQGDGGKGAMTDRLARNHQLIVRVQGGDNAGHTTVFTGPNGADVVIKNHLIPSGLRHGRGLGVLGNGVLINAERFAHELAEISAFVPDIQDRVVVSGRAHLVLPLHRLADERDEDRRNGESRAIGTTRRGIGPANITKIGRIGLRVKDLADPVLIRQRISDAVAWFGLPEAEIELNIEWINQYSELLLGCTTDTVRLINAAVDEGYSVLFEGAQGPMIDPEHGIYPFVTTSPTAIYSVSSGGGLDASRIGHRIGVLKVYQTMVGNGAFPSEDKGDVGRLLRELGKEFGTTTGRQRRCGWLDLVHARWAARLNRYTSVVLTKLDVFDHLDRIGVCVAYDRHGEAHVDFVAEQEFLSDCQPVIHYFGGWQTSTQDIATYDELPEQAKVFIEFIGRYLGVKIGGVTKGPRDSDMLVTEDSALRRLAGHP